MSTYIPYTYLIGWSHLNKWYYGVRYAKCCSPSDFWVEYFTSSEVVQDYIKQYGNPDIREIRKTFTSKYTATQWENRVLKRLNVKYNNKWLNRSIGGPNFHVDIGELKWGTDGFTEIKIPSQEDFPPGFMLGRLSRKWYNNGKDSKMFIIPPDSTWVRGRLNVNKWYNNGVEERQLLKSPDNTWVRGRLPLSTETKNKMSVSAPKTKNRVCRICDKKELGINVFTKWVNKASF